MLQRVVGIIALLALSAVICAQEAPQRLEILKIGPDSIVCGLTRPVRASGKPGLILWFHGGMRSRQQDKGSRAHLAILPFIDSTAYYVASPSAFAGRDWISPDAMHTANSLIGYLLKKFQIDRSNINLVGVSDGSLAVIHFSIRSRFPIRLRLLFSSFPQLLLKEKELAALGPLHEGSWDFFQGGKDRLYPAPQVFPFLEKWRAVIPATTLHFRAQGEHDFSWWAAHATGEIRSILK